MQVRTEGQNGMAIFSVQIVYGLHDAPTGGQTAVNKPNKAVKSHNSWPSIKQEIEDYLSLLVLYSLLFFFQHFYIFMQID